MSSLSLQKTQHGSRSAGEHDQTLLYFLERAAFGAQPQIAEILTEDSKKQWYVKKMFRRR
jgi:hypothetical protein